MKKNEFLRVTIFALLFLMVGLLRDASAKEFKIMPEELIKFSNSLGFSQIDNFYDISNSKGSPFCYGYLSDDDAIFWAKKKDKFYLIIFNKLSKEGNQLSGPQFEWDGVPNGLSIVKKEVNLKDFHEVKNHLKGYVKNRTVLLPVIIDEADGLETEFVYFENEWWFYSLD